MAINSFLLSVLSTAMIGSGYHVESKSSIISLPKIQSVVEQARSDSYAKKLVCKAGYKPGKSAAVVGGKLKCVKIISVAAGKKLLTKAGNTCFACHATTGIAPYTSMSAHIRAMNLSLSSADIKAAFDAKAGEMAGATITLKQAGFINQFLTSLKNQ